jgi:hypothetical protein
MPAPTTPLKRAWPAERPVHRPLRGDLRVRCESVEDYQAASQEQGAEILGDIVNYTDIAPVIQISEVVVERSDRRTHRIESDDARYRIGAEQER